MSINATWSAGGIVEKQKEALLLNVIFVGDIITKSCVGGIVSRMFPRVLLLFIRSG